MIVYKVTYGIWGADRPGVKYFDNKQAAYDFYRSCDAVTTRERRAKNGSAKTI